MTNINPPTINCNFKSILQFHPRKEILADHENEETEPKIRTDADTVKESEIKWTKIKLMTKTLRPFTLKQHRLQSNESTLKLNYENMEVEPEVLKPDAAIVKEMVDKWLPNGILNFCRKPLRNQMKAQGPSKV